jgi:drug/metabolite transporter (DMT)-like permease
VTPRAWFLFVSSSVIWGIPYLFIRVAVNAGVAPGFVAWSRIVIAALVLLPLAIHRGVLKDLKDRAWAILGYTACEVAIPFVLIANGERYISSSLTAILVATMPLMVAGLSVRLSPKDRPTPLRLFGLLLGLAGVVALLGIEVSGKPTELLGAGLVLVATLGYAIAPIIVSRKLADLDPLGPVTASLMVASVALLPAAVDGFPGLMPPASALWAIAILGVVATALGLLIFFRLIAEAGPNRAAVITYINPVVAVILGVLTLGEHLGTGSIVGLVLILAGSWLSTGGQGH